MDKFIAQLCAEFNDDHPSPPNIVRNFQCLRELVCIPLVFLLPPIILSSPLEQFQGLTSAQIYCPKCNENVTLHPTGWRDGTGRERFEPRKIYAWL